MKNYADIFHRAHVAGLAAGHAAEPVPMVVFSNGRAIDVVPHGPCGFAWINIRPGNSALARAAKLHVSARKAYYGGVDIWVRDFNQSYTRKMAYAEEFAKIVRELTGESRVYADGRLD